MLLSFASSAAGSILPDPITVYDALESAWEGLRTVSDIRPSDVTYQWETQTTACFSYVRLESQSDDYQFLSHISTKCETEVGYIVDVDKWRQNGTGEWIVYPDLKTGTKYLYHTPNYYANTTRALWAYVNSGSTYHDAVEDITISGPESKTVQKIYPCYPQFPDHCE